MNAKKMFEEIGYVERQYKDMIIYQKMETEKEIKQIGFSNRYKEYIAEHNNDSIIKNTAMLIDVKTHKAITKKISELGW